jgi:exopolysaccharide production protein ExoZ
MRLRDISNPGERGTLKSVQAFRGLAALLVVLFHTGLILGAAKYWNVGLAPRLFAFGESGIHFFFVISGYIIARAHESDIGRPDRLRRYALRRFVRIYPVYWIVSLVGIAGILLVGGEHLLTPRLLLGTFTLLPFAGTDAVLAVAWTLFRELAFYVAFGVLIFNRTAGLVVAAVWCLAIVTAPPLPAELAYLIAPGNLLFLMGVGAFYLLKTTRIPNPLVLGTFGLVAFFTLAAILPVRGLPAVPLGFSAALALVGFVEAERTRGLRMPRASELLGNASYSIYLTHLLILSLGAKILTTLPLGFIPPPVFFVILASGAVGFALAFYRYVEKPMLAGLRSLSEGAKATTRAEA